MRWIEALKMWNKQKSKGMWCVPKKGSEDYLEVRKIMDHAKPANIQKANEERAKTSLEQLRAVEARMRGTAKPSVPVPVPVAEPKAKRKYTKKPKAEAIAEPAPVPIAEPKAKRKYTKKTKAEEAVPVAETDDMYAEPGSEKHTDSDPDESRTLTLNDGTVLETQLDSTALFSARLSKNDILELWPKRLQLPDDNMGSFHFQTEKSLKFNKWHRAQKNKTYPMKLNYPMKLVLKTDYAKSKLKDEEHKAKLRLYAVVQGIDKYKDTVWTHFSIPFKLHWEFPKGVPHLTLTEQ